MIIRAPAVPHPDEEIPSLLLDVRRRRDNVHDFVELNEVECQLIDTPEMQRLRQIRQLGFAHLLYQSAEHSRFAHSVGVCHTAKVLIDCINRNHRVRGGSPPAPPERVAGMPKIRWVQRACVGIAALLHDLPHPPMSHALEHESSVLVRHDDVENNPQLYRYLFDRDGSGVADVLAKHSPWFWRYLSGCAADFGRTRDDLHEFLTVNGIDEDQALPALVFEILAFQARDKHPRNSFRYRKGWAKSESPGEFVFSKFFRPFYSDLISNTICADLIDYLQRDALNTGARRAVELKFLDRMFVEDVDVAGQGERVVFDLRNERHGGVRKDALSALLGLLESRYDLMERVYMHRTKLAASAMLGRAYLEAGVLPQQLYDPDGCPSDDSLLRHLLREGTPAAKHLLHQLLARRIYRPLFIIDEETCRQKMVPLERSKLIQLFRPEESDSKGWQRVRAVERQLAHALAPKSSATADKYPFIIFCMGERVAYKDPLVIVRSPPNMFSAIGGNSGAAEADGSLRNKRRPTAGSTLSLLRDFSADQGAQSQMASMVANYSALWKFYVFADWDLVKEHSDAIPAVYAALVTAMGRAYPVAGMWREPGAVGVTLDDSHLRKALERLSLSGKDGSARRYTEEAKQKARRKAPARERGRLKPAAQESTQRARRQR